MQLADPAVADQLAGEGEAAFAATLGAVLKNAAVTLHRRAHGPAFGQGYAQRLLAEHVLAAGGRGHGLHGVPVVRRADRHRVDVAAGQELAEIVVGRAAMIRSLGQRLRVVAFGVVLGRAAALGIGVGHGHHLALLQVSLEVCPTAPADPDHPHGDPVAGRWKIGLAERRGGHNPGRAKRGRADAGQEAATRERTRGASAT